MDYQQQQNQTEEGHWPSADSWRSLRQTQQRQLQRSQQQQQQQHQQHHHQNLQTHQLFLPPLRVHPAQMEILPHLSSASSLHLMNLSVATGMSLSQIDLIVSSTSSPTSTPKEPCLPNINQLENGGHSLFSSSFLNSSPSTSSPSVSVHRTPPSHHHSLPTGPPTSSSHFFSRPHPIGIRSNSKAFCCPFWFSNIRMHIQFFCCLLVPIFILINLILLPFYLLPARNLKYVESRLPHQSNNFLPSQYPRVSRDILTLDDPQTAATPKFTPGATEWLRKIFQRSSSPPTPPYTPPPISPLLSDFLDTMDSPSAIDPFIDFFPSPVSSITSRYPSGPLRLNPVYRHHFWIRSASNGCESQFGNGYSTVLPICRAPEKMKSGSDPESMAADGGSSYVCYHNEVTHATHCEATNIRIDTRKIKVSKGGEPIQSVLGRAEEEEFPVYSPSALSVACERNDEIFKSLGLGGRLPDGQKLPNHIALQIKSLQFVESKKEMEAGCDVWIEKPALLVTRYEYANLFHALTTWYQAYQAEHLFDMHQINPHDTIHPNKHIRTFAISDEEIRLAESKWNSTPAAGLAEFELILMDGHSQSAIDPVWYQLFPSVRFYSQLTTPAQHAVCFRRAVMVSPAYRAGVGVAMMKSMNECSGGPWLRDFTTAITEAFGVKKWKQNIQNTNEKKQTSADTSMDAIAKDSTLSLPSSKSSSSSVSDGPLIVTDAFNVTHEISTSTPLSLFIVRRDYMAHPRSKPSHSVQRQITNEGEVFSSVESELSRWQSVSNLTLLALDLARLDMQMQFQLVQQAELLIGMHGAGLSFVAFTHPNCTTIEIRPRDYYSRRTFEFLARWGDHPFVLMEATPTMSSNQDRNQYGVGLRGGYFSNLNGYSAGGAQNDKKVEPGYVLNVAELKGIICKMMWYKREQTRNQLISMGKRLESSEELLEECGKRKQRN